MMKLSQQFDARTVRRWVALRRDHLRSQPHCVMCLESHGKFVRGTIVDHVVPHRGDERLFLDPRNLQTLCSSHHSASKQREELAGFSAACDVDGTPIDPRHPWHNAAARLQFADWSRRGGGKLGGGDCRNKIWAREEPAAHPRFNRNPKGA